MIISEFHTTIKKQIKYLRMKNNLKRATPYVALIIFSVIIFILSGCRTRSVPAKYGGPPVTKYGIRPTSFQQIDFKHNDNLTIKKELS